MDSLQKALDFLAAYPTWVKVTVPVLIVIVILILILARPTPVPTSQLPASQLFQVRPVQSSGENIYSRQQTDPIEKFFVRVHFNLWTKHAVEIVNVDLRYGTQHWPGRQSVVFDRKQPEPTDGSYRLQQRTTLAPSSVLDVQISREFISKYSDDYGNVTVIFELSASEWQGFRLLEVTGRLAPGGELKDVKVQWGGEATA